jgi:hypothetical protein
VAVNKGEFGGSVWWFDLKGGSRRNLGDARAIGFLDIELPGRRVVKGLVEGLAHMGDDKGSLALVERDETGALSMTRLHDLPSAPQVVGAPSAKGSIVVTGTSVIAIDRGGAIKTIASLDLRALYPRSVAESPSGLIYIGMLRYYIQVDPRVSPARVTWFTDSACRKFRAVRPASCECV